MRIPLVSRLLEVVGVGPKVALPQGMVIGIPSAWYQYGYPPRVDWYRLERIYRTFPMATYAVDQMAEQAVGPGYYLKDKGSTQAVEVCTDFDEQVNATMIMLRVARELGLYGNCPLERRFESVTKEEGNEFKIKEIGSFVTVSHLPITTMRIVPDMYTGADPPAGYIQLIMGRYIRFAPEQIAWFKTNITGGAIGSDFYGMGLLQPISDYVWGLQQMEDAMIKIMNRYAAPKFLWTLGDKDFPPPPGAIDEWALKLKNVNPDEDWVAAFTTHAQTFAPDVRARFEEWTTHFKATITAGVQNPNLLLTMTPSRVSDASANAMQEAWTRKVATVQMAIKELWEDLVYKPLVAQEGLDEGKAPEVIWGVPEVEDPQQRVDELTKLLNPAQVLISAQTRFDLENMLRQLLEFEPLTTPPTPGAPPPQTVTEAVRRKKQ